MIEMKIYKSFALVLLTALIVSCGGGGGGGGDDGLVEGLPPEIDNFRFAINQNDVAEETDQNYLNYVDTQFGGAVAPLNRVDNFFNGITVPVNYQLCNGLVNAFYNPGNRSIVLCDELLVAGAQLFFTSLEEITVEQALLSSGWAMTFTLYHEMGHALDDIRGFNAVGNSESVADAIGVVLSIQTAQPEAALFGAVFLLAVSSGDTFASVHGSGEDRSGDIFCWTLGSSSRIAAQFPEIAQLFNEQGRDCVGEYANQYAAVSDIVPNLRDIPPRAAVRNRKADIYLEIGAAYDRQLAEIMREGLQ